MKKIVMSALTLAIAACMSAAPVISASASDEFKCGTPLIEQELSEKEFEGIDISVPDKKYYKEGEQLDLSGGAVYADGILLCSMDSPENINIPNAQVEIDTHQFISGVTPGVYPIHVRATINGKEFYTMFCVCVEENNEEEESDLDIDFDIDFNINADEEETEEFICGTPLIEQEESHSTGFNMVNIKTPDKYFYQIGEKLDLTGGEIYVGDEFICDMTDPVEGVVVDTHQFTNTMGGVYPINIIANIDGKDYFGVFCVSVEEPEETNLTLHDVKIKDSAVNYGDVNLDGHVSVSDSVAVMQYITNSEKYNLTDEQKANADVYNTGDGVTMMDASTIMSYAEGMIKELPVIL